MEIKRVIAGGLAAMAAGATLAFGAGAVTLQDFVTVSGSTLTSPYIVIGGNAAAEDTLAGADIGVAIGGVATKTVAVPGAQGTMSVSDGAMIEGEAYKLYVETALSDTNRKPDLTKEDLPVVLGGGTVDHKTITDVDYDEFLSMGGQQVTWSKETDWDEPALNLQFLSSGGVAYTYKIVFGGGLDPEYVEGKTVTMLGKEYVFSSQDSDLTNTSLTLYAAGQTETVAAGASTTATVDGTEYTITVVGVNTDGSAATIDVNGEAFDVSAPGGTYDSYITKGDLNVYIKSVRAFKFPAESGSVQFFLGSEKLVLDNSTAVVTKGSSEVSGSAVTFPTVSGGKIYEIQITYTPDDDTYVRSGEAFTDPIFEAFEIAYGGIYPGLTDSSKDQIEIEKSSSTKIKLKFTNKAGESCSVDVYNASGWAVGSKPIQVLNPTYGGGDVNGLNSWNASGNISEGDYFLLSQNYNSYIMQYVSTDSTNNLVKFKDLCSGTTIEASTQTGFFYLGGSKYSFVVNTGTETVRVNATGGASAQPVTLFTSGKAGVELYASKPGEFMVTEAPFSIAGIQGATQVSLNVTSTLSSGEIDTISVVNASSLAGSGLVSSETNTDLSYAVSKAGTYIVKDSDSDTLDIYTPATPTAVYVAVGADPTFASGEGVSAGTVEQAVQIKNSISKMESEVTTYDRDLVVIGGPCANSLTAEILNMSSASGTCYNEFIAEYPTEGVVTVVNDYLDSGKKALVVAGLNRDKTRALAVKVMQGTLEYSA
jgi:hypothetical protein